MNELLAAMDTPSRLDREDRVCAPRSVLDTPDPLAAGPARMGNRTQECAVAEDARLIQIRSPGDGERGRPLVTSAHVGPRV